MKNKTFGVPLFALIAVCLLASGVFAGSILKNIGSSYETLTVQVPASSQLAQAGGPLPAEVQSKSADPGFSQDYNLAFDSNTTAGNMIVVALRKVPIQNCLASDTDGNIYTLANSVDQPGDHSLFLWYAQNISGGPVTVKIECEQAGTLRLLIHEFSNIDPTSPLELVSNNIGTTNTPTAGNLNGTEQNELVFNACTVSGSVSFTPGAGYTMGQTVSGKIATEYLVSADPDLYQPTFSIDASDSWACIGAIFKGIVTMPSGGGGGNIVWGDLTGWAWSSNIGWISFNGADSGAGGGDYRVHVATSTDSLVGHIGAFSGYAWSPNVGWISFQTSDVLNCPSDGNYDTPGIGASLPFGAGSNCVPRVDTISGKVSGWARVLSMKNEPSGGWLHLSGTNHETSGGGGVVFDPVTKIFSSYAWESSVLGWVRFDTSLPVKWGVTDVATNDPLVATCTSSAGNNSVPEGTEVTFQANPTGGVAPYEYKWGGASYSSNSQTAPTVYNVTTDGPILMVRDSDTPPTEVFATDTLGNPQCPQVVVSAPSSLALYIGRDSSTSKLAHSVRQGGKFAVRWVNNLGAEYDACEVVIADVSGGDGDDGETNWKAIIDVTGSPNNLGNSPFSGSTQNLQTNTATPRGTYSFSLQCMSNVTGLFAPPAPLATLRIIGASDEEI